jgi:predicted metal-dependent hydrolase
MSEIPPRQFVPTPKADNTQKKEKQTQEKQTQEKQTQEKQTQEKQKSPSPGIPRITLENVEKIQFSDSLIHIKATNSIQASTSEINYISFSKGILELHFGACILIANVPNLRVSDFQGYLPPNFYKLRMEEDIMCFNASKISFINFLHTQNTILILFSQGGETIRFSVPEESKENIFSQFADHHEMIKRRT